MASKKNKIEYADLEKELDVQSFRDSVFEYFSLAAWNENYLTELISKFFIKSF